MWIFFNINFIAFEVQYKFFFNQASGNFIYLRYLFFYNNTHRPGTYIHVYVPAYAYLKKNEREALLYLMIR